MSGNQQRTEQQEPLLQEQQLQVQPEVATMAAAFAAAAPFLVIAAEKRATATYFTWSLLMVGLAVLLVVILMESHKWRMTISNESAAWRNLLLKFEDDLAKHFGGDG